MVQENLADKSKRREVWAFMFLAVFLAPAAAVTIVGGFGLLVWVYQLIQGPPTY
ncbi:MAG: periplasmic nitrate reductase, NapE protein [Alphaproteobacteria bacterium]|jgi:nitrate reductase NapE|nr:periplasmic nitrate reductase, NapE protein [Alphaproteobacteria bacterium]